MFRRRSEDVVLRQVFHQKFVLEVKTVEELGVGVSALLLQGVIDRARVLRRGGQQKRRVTVVELRVVLVVEDVAVFDEHRRSLLAQPTSPLPIVILHLLHLLQPRHHLQEVGIVVAAHQVPRRRRRVGRGYRRVVVDVVQAATRRVSLVMAQVLLE